MNTKQKLRSLKRPPCTDNNTNVILNLNEIMELLEKTDAAVATPQPPSGNFSMTSQNIVCAIGGCRRKPPPKKHDLAIVGEPLVPFDRVTRTLTCG